MTIITPNYGLEVPSPATLAKDWGAKVMKFGNDIDALLAEFDYNGADPNLLLSRVVALEGRKQVYYGTPAQRAADTTAPVGSIWLDDDAAAKLWRRGSGGWVAFKTTGTPTAIAGTGQGTVQAMSLVERDTETSMVKVAFYLGGRTIWTTGGQTTIGTIPLGFRPAVTVNVQFSLNGATAPYVAFGQIGTDGSVSLFNSPNSGQSWNAHMSTNYKVAS